MTQTLSGGLIWPTLQSEKKYLGEKVWNSLFSAPEDLSKNLMGANAVRANYELKGDTIVYKRYFETLRKFNYFILYFLSVWNLMLFWNLFSRWYTARERNATSR